MKKSLIFINILFLLAVCSLVTAQNSIVILHTNDTHSQIEPLQNKDGSSAGGIYCRAAIIDQVRQENKNVLLVDAGDFCQGTPYFNFFKGASEIRFMNLLGYQAAALGNHEFDNGLEELGRRLSSLQCPVVSANYDFTPFEAGKYITPYTIVRKAGINIGIIGLLCDVSSVVSRETADRMPLLGTNEEVANKWAKYLKEEAPPPPQPSWAVSLLASR